MIQVSLPFHLRHAANVGVVVVLNAPKIIFTLDVEHAKNGIGIGFSADMRDVPFVAGNADSLGLGFPAGKFRSAEGLAPGATIDEE